MRSGPAAFAATERLAYDFLMPLFALPSRRQTMSFLGEVSAQKYRRLDWK
jgi:hypothetical protein